MFIYFEIWVESLSTGVRFVLTNASSSKLNIVLGGAGYHFLLRSDLLRRPLKGRPSTFAAIFSCVPTTSGNDCMSLLCCQAKQKIGNISREVDVSYFKGLSQVALAAVQSFISHPQW